MMIFYTYTPVIGEQYLVMIDNNIISFVPIDESNANYHQYLIWVEQGNTPEEWIPEEIN